MAESVLASAVLRRPWLPTHPTPLTHLTEPPPRITLSASRVRPPDSCLRIVERRRLLDRVSRAVADAPFTLISAPAGYGKTVLASEWAQIFGALGQAFYGYLIGDGSSRTGLVLG